jgi:hypothetical protein
MENVSKKEDRKIERQYVSQTERMRDIKIERQRVRET